MPEKFFNLIHNIPQPSSRLAALAALICLANKATEYNSFLQKVKALNVSILVKDRCLTGIQVPEENIKLFNDLFKSFSWTKPAKESTTPLKPQGSFARLKKTLHPHIEPNKETNVIILKITRLKLSQNEEKALEDLSPELVTAYNTIESMPNKEPAAAAARPKKRKAVSAAMHMEQKTENQKKIRSSSPTTGKPADHRTVSPTGDTLKKTDHHDTAQHGAGEDYAHLIKYAKRGAKFRLFPKFDHIQADQADNAAPVLLPNPWPAICFNPEDQEPRLQDPSEVSVDDMMKEFSYR